MPSTSVIRDPAPNTKGVPLRPTGSTHTHLMRFSLDAVFLDRELRVIDVRRELGPWRMARKRGAKAVLELRAGEAGRWGVRDGDRLSVAFRGEERDG